MSTETVTLWRCQTHGYIEDGSRRHPAPENDNPHAPVKDYRFCPIAFGWDEVCDMQLDGPVAASIAGQKSGTTTTPGEG